MEDFTRTQVGVRYAVGGRTFGTFAEACDYARSVDILEIVEVPEFAPVEREDYDEVDPGPPTCPVHGPVGALIDGKCRQCLGLRERSGDLAPLDIAVTLDAGLRYALTLRNADEAVGYLVGYLTPLLPADQMGVVFQVMDAARDRWYGAPVEG